MPRATSACSAVGVTLSARAGAARSRSASRPPASPTGSRSACRTTASSREAPFDAISSVGMFEHVGAAQTGRVLRLAVRAAAPGRDGCSTTPSRARAATTPRVSAATRSWRATSSRTAPCSRSVASSRPCRTPGSRCATSSRCASTTHARCVPGSRTSSAIARRPNRSRARPGRASGTSTWRRRRSPSSATASRSTRCSGYGPTEDGSSHMPASRRWLAAPE